MSYAATPPPLRKEDLLGWLTREVRRLEAALRDNAPVVCYRTEPLTPAYSADNFAPVGAAGANVWRISASVSQTITGIKPLGAWRELVLLNVGTGTVILTSEDAASSASSRFALPATWNLSANAGCLLWYDAVSSRWRGVAKT